MSLQDFFLNLGYNKNALFVGLALAATCGLLSVFIVLRKMAMISESVAHSGIGGYAIALLIGYYVDYFNHPSWGPILSQVVTAVFCLVTAFVIGYVAKGKHVSEDSAIGIFLVASVAFGLLLLRFRTTLPPRALPAGYPPRPRVADVENVLFGGITGVSQMEVFIAVGAMLLVFAIVFALYNEFVYTTLDEEMARINGVRTSLINMLLLGMIALVVVVGSRMVGAIMITALMVIPGATACMISRKFNQVVVASLVICVVSVGGGIIAASNPPLGRYPTGPIFVMILFLVFVSVWVIRKVFKPKLEAHSDGAGSPEPLGEDAHPHAHGH